MATLVKRAQPAQANLLYNKVLRIWTGLSAGAIQCVLQRFVRKATQVSNPQERAARGAALDPDRYVIVEDAGHFSALQNPEAVAGLILAGEATARNGHGTQLIPRKTMRGARATAPTSI
jgi:hypothetical protein